MLTDFAIDRDSGVAGYLQLAEYIARQLRTGALRPGDKLPTVRELARLTKLSDGTVRHAYDELRRRGELELRQGKGTFVREPDQAGREARAMLAIDRMLDQMTDLGISMREARMYLSIKLAERGEEMPLMPVALIDCNPESLEELASQLAFRQGIELTECLLDDVRRAPGTLLRGFALIVTTEAHYHELITLAGDRASHVAALNLTLAPETMIRLARLTPLTKTGLFYQSERFAATVRNELDALKDLHMTAPATYASGAQADMREFLASMQALLVAPDYLSFATRQEQDALRAFSNRGGMLIPLRHMIDRGSMKTLEDRLDNLAYKPS